MENIAIFRILEEMTAKDKDYRYLATYELLDKLNKEELILNNELESRLSKTVLNQLYDAACEVSELALKCLLVMVKIMHKVYVLEMVIKLSDTLLEGKERHMEISSATLKAILSEVPTSQAKSTLVFIIPKLVKGITAAPVTATNPEIKCACLDILYETLQAYGNLMSSNHELLLGCLLPQLSFSQFSVRKQTVSCIASLALNLSDDLLAKATGEVVRHLKSKGVKPEISRTNIQMLGALSCAVGYRFGIHLRDTIPVLLNYGLIVSENNDELREYSLQALESFLLRCSRDIFPYCDDILHVIMECLCYDPNFADNMDESTDDERQDEDQCDESDDGYSDDEDVSWKVRRAAAKCLAALIVSRPEMLTKLYVEACPKLIDRFKEREEVVKTEVFNTFIELLHQTGNLTKRQNEINESSPKWLLIQEVPKVIKSINMQLREKSVKTKVGAFSVLKELAVILPDIVADHIGYLVPRIEKALCDKVSTSILKIEALIFTRLVLASHSSTVFYPYIKAISGPVLLAVGESFHRVTAEALRVCGEIVRVICTNIEGYGFDSKMSVYPIYNAIMPRLQNQDQDKEVKECAISCMGLVVSTFGDNLREVLPECLPTLADRMGNEITRLTAVKASLALRQAALETLNVLIATNGDKIGSATYGVIIEELSTLIRNSDLHVAALALKLCSTVLADRNSTPKVCSTIRNKVFPHVLTLVRSSLLQEQVLTVLQSFFAAVVYAAHISFDDLLGSLISTNIPSFESGGCVLTQSLFSIAQCVAVLCLAAGDQKCSSTVKMLAAMLKEDSTAYSVNQHLYLLCLGEIGRRKDLSSHARIENIVIDFFQSPSEEIKSAASYALGNIAVGNIPRYLPFILDQIDNQKERQYLLLHSLKEVVVRQSVDKADFQDSSVEKILNLLFNHCESEDEGIRNVVAESLGKIALIMPEKLVPELKARLTSPAAFTRETAVIAVKYFIIEFPQKIEEIIYHEISSFLMHINDQDSHVRRAALLALGAAAQNKPTLLKGILPELLPQLYGQTMIKKELLRTVDLVPNKHTVDDGLELRKAAFECIDTLFDCCLHQMSPSSFIVPYLISGLDDTYDIKLLCHLILSKLVDKCPFAVLAVLDSVIEPLQKTLRYSPKQDAVKQEIDRNEDMIRSALRTIASLNSISGANQCRGFRDLVNNILNSSTLGEKFRFIRNE